MSHHVMPSYVEGNKLPALIEMPVTIEMWRHAGIEQHLGELGIAATSDIPDGYGFVGGAARRLLRSHVGTTHAPNEFGPLRDIDLVDVRGDIHPDPFQRELFERYSPDDAQHRKSLTAVHDVAGYFTTVDLTCNQAMVVGSEAGIQLVTTQQAISDTREAIVRPVEQQFENGRHSYAIGLRAVMLFQRLASAGLNPSMVNVGPDYITNGRDGLNTLVALHKSLELGPTFATDYFEQLKESGLMKPTRSLINEYSRLGKAVEKKKIIAKPYTHSHAAVLTLTELFRHEMGDDSVTWEPYMTPQQAHQHLGRIAFTTSSLGFTPSTIAASATIR